MISNDQVTVTTIVDADPKTAFHLFTREIDLWWKRGPRYRNRDGILRFDAGRLLEAEEQIGKVLAWDPGSRLLLEMWTWSFRAGERTQVEVCFEPVAKGTRVTIEHRGWSPRGGAEFRTTVGLWWGDLLPAINKLAASRSEF